VHAQVLKGGTGRQAYGGKVAAAYSSSKIKVNSSQGRS